MRIVYASLNTVAGAFEKKNAVCVRDGYAAAVTDFSSEDGRFIPLKKGFLFPGFVDVHVHFREPGFSYKETILSGTRAAAHGGYTAVCTMPNLSPVPDSALHLAEELRLIRAGTVLPVYPYGALTVGEKGREPAALEEMAGDVIAFSDDGRGVQSEDMMRQAMITARRLGKMIAAHCEDETLVHGGCVHAGRYAAQHGLPGISSESEWRPLERDLRLAAETGCAYHACHISCRESVELIRRAKVEGVNVSCETAPHYLLLDEENLCDDGRFKMNPPLRTVRDREALREGLADGTVDMIATDHAPHAAPEKSGGLQDSLNGIVGLETAFAALYTGLVRPGLLSLDTLIDRMALAPRRRFGLPLSEEDFTVFDLDEEYTVDSTQFFSKGRSTPFEGQTVYGKCRLTAVGGKTIWQEALTEN